MIEIIITERDMHVHGTFVSISPSAAETGFSPPCIHNTSIDNSNE
jgi:hypothetical protein